MNMRCPYCEGKMRKGQLHAVGAGAGLEWKEDSESLRLNTDPELVARISGDRIAAYNCDFAERLLFLTNIEIFNSLKNMLYVEMGTN